MVYPPHIWVGAPDPANPPAGATKVSTTWLNEMEAGIQAAAQRADDAYTLAEAAGGGGGVSTAGDFGAVSLDSFTGADDDAKLTAAMAAIGSDTFPRAIQLSNRRCNFATGNRVPFEGMKIMGPRGFSNPERNSQTKMAGRVHLSMTGPWFHNGGGTPFQVSFWNLALTGGSNATFLGQSGGGTWDCLHLRDIYSSGLKSLLGTQSTKMLLTAATFDGTWEINNCYTGAIHVGGSDNSFGWSQCLLDSGTAFAASGGSSGQAHFWADSLDKTYVGPMYVTAEGPWRGIRHDGPDLNSGSTNTGAVVYDTLRLEGRNPGAPCDGALFKMSGGVAEIRSGWIAYGMEAPSASEKGVIHHDGGQLDVQGVAYDPYASAVLSDTTRPFVYTAGGAGKDCIVQRIKRGSRGAVSWGTNRPRVAKASAGAENRITDATVTQITV